MFVWHLSESVHCEAEGKKTPRESSICDTPQHPSTLPTLTHIQTACTHYCFCCTLSTSRVDTEKKHRLRRPKAEMLRNSSVRGLFRGEPRSWCAAGSSEGTAVHLKQALFSWDRHGYHGNKKKNINNKRPDRQQAFSDFPLFESPCACEAVVPTAVPRRLRLLHGDAAPKNRRGYSWP